jgi:cytochrome c biogenesis protein CcmG/thiol:disulfide interchange protein DsbE
MADGSRRPRVAPFVALAVAAVLAGLFWVLAGSDASSGDTADSFLLGKPAPRVVTTTLDDRPFDLSRRKGSWVVLNFFNSTCVPCKAEHPELVAFVAQQRGLGLDGAEMYTVVNDDSDSAVREWFAANGGDWPILRDDDGAIAIAFGVAKVPETWVIDPNGTVLARYAGVTTAESLGTLLQRLRGGGG